MASSLIFKHLAFLLIVLSSILQNSYQQDTTPQSNIIEAHCLFSFDPQNRYNCYLFNIRSLNTTDVLEFTGAHMPNQTDADVHGIIHTGSMITQFNGEALRKFVNLRRILLRAVFLESINPTAFDVCGQLEELDISFNAQLPELPQRMLANCGNLRTFVAANTRFPTVPEDLFGDTRSLEVINFGLSRLMSLPDNLLRNMANLRSFQARNNQLTFISPTNFMNAVNLQEIDLFFNNLNDTQSVMNLLNGHFGLRRIILTHNLFSMFSLNFFTQFTNLEELGIGGRTNLTDIQWLFLPGTLQTLTVRSISEEIPENAFVGLPNLRFLDISGYGITVLQPNTFSPLVKLDRLDIIETHLKTFHPQQFTSQRLLRALHLSFNEIEELPEGVFAPLSNLGFNETTHGLFMIGNRLRRLSANSFGQHPHLNYIYFSNNQIIDIERGLFSRFNPRPALIDFFHNECIHWAFFDEENLDEHPRLEYCFNNFEGITTTTPSGAVSDFRKFQIFVVAFLGIFSLFVNFL